MAANLLDNPIALLQQIVSGDGEAFSRFYDRYASLVFTFALRLLGSRADAEDLLQEVFLRVYRARKRYIPGSKFSTWLTSIAINTGTELLRQRRPSESLDQGEDGDEFRPRQIQSWADDPEQVLAASQRTQLVREGVLRLPEKYRVVVLLRDINQLSTEEAAAALGLSIPAVKARLLRGRLMLREGLAPYFIRMEKRSPDAQLR